MKKHSGLVSDEEKDIETTDSVVKNNKSVFKVSVRVPLNIRKEPNIRSKAIGMANAGSVYEIESERNEWGKIRGEEQWISIRPAYVDRL